MTKTQSPEFTLRVRKENGDYIIECTQHGYNWSTIRLRGKEQVEILITLLEDALRKYDK